MNYILGIIWFTTIVIIIAAHIIIEDKEYMSYAELTGIALKSILVVSIPFFGAVWFLNVITESHEHKNSVLVKTEIHRIVLTGIKPPKHAYVSFVDKTSNQYYDSVYVAKHCEKWKDNQIGDEYNVQFNVYKQLDGKIYQKPIQLDSVFCE